MWNMGPLACEDAFTGLSADSRAILSRLVKRTAHCKLCHGQCAVGHLRARCMALQTIAADPAIGGDGLALPSAVQAVVALKR